MNKQWTIKIEHQGMIFYITDMVFQDIAQVAANGIRQAKPDAIVSVFFAKGDNDNEAN